MKLRILLFLMMSFAHCLQASVSKFSLQNYPENEIFGLVDTIEISQLKLSAVKGDKYEVYVDGKAGEKVLQGKMLAKVKESKADEKVLQVILFARNLTGPCDYNGFQKISLLFRVNELDEILLGDYETKLMIIQRDLSCANKFQSFSSLYL